MKLLRGRDPTSWVGGALAVVFLFAGYYLVGNVQHESEARARIEAAIPTVRFLASGVIAGTATILALMLTLLGITQTHDAEFSTHHFNRLRRLASLNVAAMVGSVFLLMVLTMPVTDSERLQGFYTAAYYLVVGASALIGGIIIAIALELRRSVIELIEIFDPSADSALVQSDPT